MTALGGRRLSPGFSVVVPVSTKDLDMIPKTLPAYLKLQAGEIILCVDSPVDPALRQAIEAVGRGDPRLRIVEVPADPSWKFHQALARRTGFRAASSDVILTGDIDVVVNSNVLRGVELVGRNNVGVANLQKDMRSGPGDLIGNTTRRLVRMMKKESFWTGLYALYRPYWLDTENEENAKAIPHPLDHGVIAEDDEFYVPLARKGRLSTPPYLGDDTMLKRAILLRHKVMSLPFVGGVEIRQETDRRPGFQTRQAVWLYSDGRSFPYMLVKATLYARGRMLGTFMLLMGRKSGLARLMATVLASPIHIVRYAEEIVLAKAGLKSTVAAL